jgi:hypothetical protein
MNLIAWILWLARPTGGRKRAMSVFEQPLTRGDFDRLPWQEVVEAAGKKTCHEYMGPFMHRARLAREAGDRVAEAAYAVLFLVTDVELRHGDINQPFGPRFVAKAGRGVAAEDLNDQHWAILAELGPTVADAELRARICDLVWVVKRNPELGKLAVAAYLDSAKLLEDADNWPPCAWRIERAVRLARSIRGADGLFDSTVRHVEDLVTRLNGEDPRFLTGVLMELLLEFRKGDPAKYAPLAERAAGLAEEANDFDRACRLWLRASEWHRMAGDAAANERCRIRSAETHVKEAALHATREARFTPHMHAASSMERAILALSRIQTPAARALHQKYYPLLTQYQEKARAEMPAMSHSIDMTEAAKQYEEQVAGLPLGTALHVLGGICKPPEVARLRKQAEEYFRSPILGLMGVTRVTNTGKIAARAPSFESSPEAAEEAVRAQMHSNAILHRQCVTVGAIIPAIWRIRSEHNVRLQDFYDLVSASPFVPPGREMTFAKGLYAGFTFDLIVSTHLLIPQIENSIRLHLEAIGSITSGFDKQWRQNEHDLNTTLRNPDLKKIYNDDDLIFDLQGLLIEHHGSNLRNEMAHGLLDDNQLGTDAAMYLWALTLRLCCMRLREEPERADEPITPPPTAGT